MPAILLPDAKFSKRFAKTTAMAPYTMTERLKCWVAKQHRRHLVGLRSPGVLRGSPMAEALALGALMECMPDTLWPAEVTPEVICRVYSASGSHAPEELMEAIEEDLRQGILDGDLPVIGRPACPTHNPVTKLTQLMWAIWLGRPGDPFLKAAAWGFISPDFRPVVAGIWQDSDDPTLEAIADLQLPIALPPASLRPPPRLRR